MPDPKEVFSFPNLMQIFDNHGLTEDFVALELKRLARAKKNVVSYDPKDQEFVISAEFDDNQTQLKAVTEIAKIRRMYVERIEGNITVSHEEALKQLDNDE